MYLSGNNKPKDMSYYSSSSNAWPILSCGRINLLTGEMRDSYSGFKMHINEDGPDAALELWRKPGKNGYNFRVMRSWTNCSTQTGTCHNFKDDQTGRSMGRYQFIGFVPAAEMAQIIEVTGKKSLPIACYQ